MRTWLERQIAYSKSTHENRSEQLENSVPLKEIYVQDLDNIDSLLKAVYLQIQQLWLLNHEVPVNGTAQECTSQ